MMPWLLASGMFGASPIACQAGAPKRRKATMTPPTKAVPCAMKSMTNAPEPVRGF